MTRKSSPNRGGYRDGAGRPAEVPGEPNTVRVQSRISPALSDEFVAARGSESEAEALREAIRLYIAAKKSPTTHKDV